MIQKKTLFLKNFFKDIEDEIDLDGSDITDLINITEVLPEIEINQTEIDVVYKATLNGTLHVDKLPQFKHQKNEINNHLS